jgi:hypothetical protein
MVFIVGIPNPLHMTHICSITPINTSNCLNKLVEGDNKSQVEVVTRGNNHIVHNE